MEAIIMPQVMLAWSKGCLKIISKPTFYKSCFSGEINNHDFQAQIELEEARKQEESKGRLENRNKVACAE